jgi:cation diffusion facilitator family transporter
VDPGIKRSREGLQAVAWSLGVLGATALAQTVIFLASGSVALLADLIHNAGDALTAVPLAVAFVLHSDRAEKRAGLFVVGTIFASACIAGVESIRRLVSPAPPSHLAALAIAGAIGYLGNMVAARIRIRAGRTLDSPALVADGHHAHADAYVSAAVIISAAAVALGVPIADPVIGLGITVLILRIAVQSWHTMTGNAR